MTNHSLDTILIQFIAEIENGRTDEQALPLLKEAIDELQERYYEIEAEAAWNKEADDDND